MSGTPHLTGKIVVVAGATGAAGPPLVTALVAAGAQVVAVGRDGSRLESIVSAAREAVCGGSASAGGAAAGTDGVAGAEGTVAADDVGGADGAVEAAVVDLVDEARVREWAADLVARHGRVDGLFHLVGGWRGGTGIVESDLADWTWLHDQLVVTVQHTTRALHDPLVAAGGRLAIVSTVQAPTATTAAYASAKAASEAWVLAVADSFERAGGAAAATIVQVKALLTDQMRQERPERTFPGYTRVDDLATHFVGLWKTPAAQLNGRRDNLVS